MGYQITYSAAAGKAPAAFRKRCGLTWVFMGMFLMLVLGFWPEGKEALLKLLWPGDMDVTLQAVETFLNSLRCGLSLWDAAEVFCREVLTGANLLG